MFELSCLSLRQYRVPSRLFISGGKELLSQEGTTQGDNFAMGFYGLSTIPIQTSLRFEKTHVKQVWLADDATAGGTLYNLKFWWDRIIDIGAKLGYLVNQGKSWLILKDASKLDHAKEVFSNSPINLSTSGQRHLGAVIGDLDFREKYVKEKVENWCSEIERLSEFALSEPHAAFSAFIHGEQHRFTYFLRTIPGMEKYLNPLNKVIDEKFISAIFGSSFN